MGAVRALALNGGSVGALLLKLKVLTGEGEPDVLAECFSGLLAAAPARSLPLVARFIDSENTAVAEAALLALGSSRLAAALDLLKTRCERTAGGPLRQTVLLAIAMIRSEAAIDFLLASLTECTAIMAKEVVAALALFRNNEKVRSRVASVVEGRNEKAVSETFRREF